MTETLESVVGTWTLFVRTRQHQATATYTATFEASGTDASHGTVTVSAGGTSVTGSWRQAPDMFDEDQNVHFTIPDPAGSGEELHFSGHLVGNAMGGTIRHGINPFFGAWSACRSGG
ncbi:MAG TPA: hypothetical protein VF006_26650 [Longimicrobium sp.]